MRDKHSRSRPGVDPVRIPGGTSVGVPALRGDDRLRPVAIDVRRETGMGRTGWGWTGITEARRQRDRSERGGGGGAGVP
jgi:hypothetical protein